MQKQIECAEHTVIINFPETSGNYPAVYLTCFDTSEPPEVFKNTSPFTGGAKDFLRIFENSIVPGTETVLSEHISKNPRMARVQTETEKIVAMFKKAGISTFYEQNPGNHFTKPYVRTAKGIEWIREKIEPAE